MTTINPMFSTVDKTQIPHRSRHEHSTTLSLDKNQRSSRSVFVSFEFCTYVRNNDLLLSTVSNVHPTRHSTVFLVCKGMCVCVCVLNILAMMLIVCLQCSIAYRITAAAILQHGSTVTGGCWRCWAKQAAVVENEFGTFSNRYVLGIAHPQLLRQQEQRQYRWCQ